MYDCMFTKGWLPGLGQMSTTLEWKKWTFKMNDDDENIDNRNVLKVI